ncbi:hypothetical protein ACM55F_06395 [Flavobacterium sp. XS2P12]|uniref:hypothetical protein n=1 Tax=Flavobacterium melibiosi TaxID=3398734 RepID=UPI003A87C412
MNLKIKFLARFLSLILMLTFLSCEKDLYEDAIQQKKELNTNTVSLRELSKKDNEKLFKAVDNLNLKNENILSKKRYNQINNFYFDDTNGREIISVDGHKSYTFQIYNKDVNKKIENVLFTENVNGEYDVFRVKYDFNEEDYKKLNKKDILKHKVVYEPIINARTTEFCLTIYTIYSGDCTRTHENSYTCNEETITSEQYCADDYTTIIENNSSYITISETGWGNGTFVNTNTTMSPSGVFTTLVITPGMTFINSLNFDTPEGVFSLSPDAQQIIFNYLDAHNFDDPTNARVKYVLDHFNFFWINEQPAGTDIDIFNYLAQNNFSSNSESFIKQCITRMSQNPTTFTSIIPLLIENKIDDTYLDPCGKGVFQQIKNATICDFANVFAKLGADDSVYNTTIKTAHNSVVINGQLQEIVDPANTIRTTLGTKYNYTVYVNPDYPDKTKLFIAAFLLHEMAHTYFFSVIDDYNMGATNSFNELPILFNAAVTNHFPIGPNLHHEEIANSYVSAIAAALKEFQPGLSQQVYDDLAWGGLYGTPIFDTLLPVGNPNRERIINRYACEQTGSPVGQGTANLQSPMGQPCN